MFIQTTLFRDVGKSVFKNKNKNRNQYRGRVEKWEIVAQPLYLKNIGTMENVIGFQIMAEKAFARGLLQINRYK